MNLQKENEELRAEITRLNILLKELLAQLHRLQRRDISVPDIFDGM